MGAKKDSHDRSRLRFPQNEILDLGVWEESLILREKEEDKGSISLVYDVSRIEVRVKMIEKWLSHSKAWIFVPRCSTDIAAKLSVFLCRIARML